jgi:hypothetical protein
MNRVRSTSAMLGIGLAIAVTTLVASGTRVPAGQEPAPKPAAAPARAREDGKASDVKATDTARTPAAAPDPVSLQTIGTLTAAHYFQTYLNIGFIADGKGKGTYSQDDARKVLQSVLSVVDSVDRQLEVLGKRNLDKGDRESLEQMRAISAQLRQQGQDLQAYWTSGKDEDAARYDALRQKTYGAISKLMGIDR